MAPLLCTACDACATFVSARRPTVPPCALANNNVCLPPPPELQGLSLGEQMFIARGFAVRRLRALTTSGDPQSRQRGLLGTASAIAFPQNACSILTALPVRAADLAEYLSVFFTDATQSNLHLCKEFVVRRTTVHTALRWLVRHNPYYADLQIDLAALEDLPLDGVPSAWLQQAQSSTTPLTRNFGPADATSAPDISETSSSIHAAVLDPSIDDCDPLHMWHTALLACERFEKNEHHRPDAATSDVQLAHTMLQRLAGATNHKSFEQDSYHQRATDAPHQKLYAILPHSDEPLDSYHPSFWTFCFPVLFPYGEGIDGQPRVRYLTDHAWGSSLLRRRDRCSATHWRKDLDFVAVLFSVLHRRRLLRAVRIRVQAPTFREAIPSFCTLRTTDWLGVANAVGESLTFCLFSCPSVCFYFLFLLFVRFHILNACCGPLSHYATLLPPSPEAWHRA